MTPAGNEDRLLTIPNLFTLVRLGCIPLFLYLLVWHHPHLRYQAAGLLALLGCTDWVDGYLARHLGQVSTAGKILDPVADRLLLLAGVGGIWYVGAVPTWVAVVALARESLVATATVVLAALGARRIDVTWFGKAGTFGLMVAFPLFLTSHSTANWHRLAGDLAWVATVPGLTFGVYALVLYVPMARKALTEGRAARTGDAMAATSS
ncbi:MAG TPA: CDP-alcohol phosphatidyltransferase family protein [Acidimicrobiales bacterium]|nr:CDP-alcohol phosphatidyltransferase family protein [Acidimicrobiales bacterium]